MLILQEFALLFTCRYWKIIVVQMSFDIAVCFLFIAYEEATHEKFSVYSGILI